jgi:hypothetical protein
LVSWWPLPTQWNNTTADGYNWEHWTEWDKLWYCQQCLNICDGDRLGAPFTASVWQSKLKGASVAKSTIKGLDIHSDKPFFKK